MVLEVQFEQRAIKTFSGENLSMSSVDDMIKESHTSYIRCDNGVVVVHGKVFIFKTIC